MAWLVVVVMLGLAIVAVAIITQTSGRGPRKRGAERGQPYDLPETDQRVPLADQAGKPAQSTQTINEINPPPGAALHRPWQAVPSGEPARPADSGSADQTPAEHGQVLGRVVSTPDGEAILTTPPFALRESVFSKKNGRYAAALVRRLPPWIVVCPKVRLDTLLTPTSPDGRDAEDWRTWRHRVRVRCVDLLLCDRRTWRPLVAVILHREVATGTLAVKTIGGGQDRMVDEVLATAGLPLVRATGSLGQDWPAIRPYVEEAMLPSPPDAEGGPGNGKGWDASAAVTLLRMEEEQGWLLE